MDGNSNNKHKPRPSFSEGSNSRDGSFNGNQWGESSREHRRDHGKNLDPSREGEWSRDKPFNGKRESSREEREEPQSAQPVQQTASFPTYNYNGADQTYVDSSKRACMMPYMIASMNTPWSVNPMDGMAMNQSNIAVNQSPTAMPMATPMLIGLEMVQASGSGVNPYAFMTMPGDNMYGVVGMGNYCQYNMMPIQESMYFPQVKEVITFSKGILYPPNPTAPRPTTRKKPLGCKTVFVGGLPEKCTEEIIREIFERCGSVETIRMSKKNFGHVRFSNEMSVEHAIYFSGYRLKIENKDETPYNRRLHVDYAQARDDQFEYECRQQSLQRQARHQEQDCYRSVTPPVVHYTDHEASVICEKLKTEETFSSAAGILITWLERGECTKKNAGNFYSMIQSTHNHVGKLQGDKVKYEEQLNDAKKMLKKQLEGIIRQFTEIGKIYKAASLQKCWDHFTKAQRKNIEMWKKQTEELKNAHVEEVINEREDEEMELSDDDSEENKKTTDVEQVKSQLKEDIQNLKEECDSLKCQLEHAQNEITVVKCDHQDELKSRDETIASLRQSVQSMKKELMNLNERRSKDEAELKELRTFKLRRRDEGDDNEVNHDSNDLEASASSSHFSVEFEGRLITLIAMFLQVHPFGANLEYIFSFLSQLDLNCHLEITDIEFVMKKFPKLFKQETSGIGATLEKKWFYSGF